MPICATIKSNRPELLAQSDPNLNHFLNGESSMARPKCTTAPIGKRFGKRVVLGYSHHDVTMRASFWFVRCDCGRVDSVAASGLPKTEQCRVCSHKANTSMQTHGMVHTPEYSAWNHIKQRIFNPKCKGWKDYGGRGIQLCEGWQNPINFLNDMGKRPTPKHSIDRVNNNGHYSCGHCKECVKNGWPRNCRWATSIQQANNTPQNRILEFRGYRFTVVEWQRLLEAPRGLVQSRLIMKWSIERALTTPPDLAWRCLFCQTQNKRNNKQCIQCGLARPKLNPLAALQETLWRCSTCDELNSPNVRECRECFEPRLQPMPQGNAEAAWRRLYDLHRQLPVGNYAKQHDYESWREWMVTQ